jgi:hypothetical protein
MTSFTPLFGWNREAQERVYEIISGYFYQETPLPRNVSEFPLYMFCHYMTDKLIGVESDFVSKSLANNPLIALDLYGHMKTDSDKKRLVDSVVTGLKDIEHPSTFFKDLIELEVEEYHGCASRKESFFNAVYGHFCSEPFEEDVRAMMENLDTISRYPPTLLEDEDCRQRLDQALKNGEDLHPIYETITDRLYLGDQEQEEDVMMERRIYIESDDDFKKVFRQKLIDVISSEIEKYLLVPLSASFKEERKALFRSVINRIK